MKKQKLKLADIAELAGVSKSTVSFVLNGHAKKHRITKETVEKVEAIARKHHYSPSLYARALKSKQTFTMGLIIPDLANMGFANIAKVLEKQCREAGYQLLIASSEDDPQLEKLAIENLLERQVDLIMIASTMQDDSFYLNTKQFAPVVLFDRVIDSESFTNIKTDAVNATEQLVGRLVQDATECVYIGGQLELSPSRDRFQGYQLGLEKAGVPFEPRLVRHKDYQSASGYAMIKEVVAEVGYLPKTVFTASYTLLEGVLKYLTDNDLLDSGVRLATFDNYAILDCLPIKIDAVEQDCDLIAQSLFKHATRLLDDPEASPQWINLPAKVHLRHP